MAEKKTTTRKTADTTKKVDQPKAKKAQQVGQNYYRVGDTVRMKGQVFKVAGFTKKGLELTLA